MYRPIYLTKSLVTASSTGLGSISSAATPVVTVKTSALDTARRIQFSSTGGNISSGVTFTVTGTIEGGGTKIESIFSSTGAAITTLDFLSITSVVVSCGTLPISIGTNTTGGTRWVVVDEYGMDPINGSITFSSSSNSMTGSLEWTMDDPLGLFPITRLGQPYPQPTVWISSIVNGVTGATEGIINIDGQLPVPVSAVRLTITSSSSGAGTVYATILQH